MTNTSATLLENNTQQAFEKFDNLVSKEGTQAVQNQWLIVKQALDAPSESDTPNLSPMKPRSSPDTNVPCQGPGCDEQKEI